MQGNDSSYFHLVEGGRPHSFRERFPFRAIIRLLPRLLGWCMKIRLSCQRCFWRSLRYWSDRWSFQRIGRCSWTPFDGYGRFLHLILSFNALVEMLIDL